MTPNRDSQLEAVLALAAGSPRADDPPDLTDFLRAYFGDAHPEHLQARPAAELLAIGRRHRALAANRADGQTRVDIYTPETASPETCAVATVAADMPFLVDTVSMAVRATGGAIDWLLHPMLRLQRDDDGGLRAIRGVADSSVHGDEESLIHIQFEAGPGFDQDALAERLPRVLGDLRVTVADYPAMRRQLQAVVDELGQIAGGVDAAEVAEGRDFLRWLADDHFTFLGYRRRQVVGGGDGDGDAMVGVPNTSLGLLREGRPGIDPDGYVAPAAELDKYAASPRLVVVTKANAHAWIHHAEFMDVIAVKRLDDTGNVIGAHRFLGLFSSEAYAASPRSIPMLRRKLDKVNARAALRPHSHAAKTLDYVLETYPRDELFQSGEDELFDMVLGAVALRESQRLRLFLRRDRYGRFFSCLVYFPRERYSLVLRRRVGERLTELLEGTGRESWTQVLRDGLVRVHYIVATAPGTEAALSTEQIEAELIAATRSWHDDFREAARAAGGFAAWAEAFPGSYTEVTGAAEALQDARVLAAIEDDAPRLRLLVGGGQVRLKLYGRGGKIALAAVLPLFEHFGLLVTDQWPYEITPPTGEGAWIQAFAADMIDAAETPDADDAKRIEAAFAEVWAGRAEDDGLNRLLLAADLDVREIILVRALTRYLLQTQLPFSPSYIEAQFAAHPRVVAALVKLFHARCAPELAQRRRQELEQVETIHAALDQITSLDADRLLRALLAVVLATLRTNYFQPDEHGGPKSYISLKLNPAQIPDLPRPLPMFETFVYAPQVEGVHLRAGKVARGGIRWSDRREDFRTEVLGLMKAQVVKNSVIVPVGAKGGFVVKNAPDGEDREARQQRGIGAYKTFMRGLLDITDNRDGDAIAAPAAVVRHDGDDPYLVVAADKGTASFSDIANAISHDYGYWLDDAFASGGSAGYDHKAMGITARGAWEAVARHFREMGVDVATQEHSAVGIGDMGGDVFGNGMLRSEHTRLIAAFNHKHIFIDPNPDTAAAFAERQRLYQCAGGWDAYDPAKLSEGGGIYPRSEKSIALSEPARAALGIQAERLAPNELIHQILQAPVDLLWNGGIGTYVKARQQSHPEVGDRANDALRVDGRDLRCKVVGEGGNLGFTQAGRVEYARAGGRLNTDAIDNSAGVDCSDLEVNIKIALGPAVAAGRLARAERDALLAQMTDDVAALVLRTNYLQTQVISALETSAAMRFDEHVNLMRALEREGQLDRALEGLPDDEAIEERQRQSAGLTRPELAVLVSYAKIALYAAVLESDLPDDPYLERALLAGFPERLRAEHAEDLRRHRLKRELIATLVTNQMVDRMGVALGHRMAAERGVGKADVLRAYLLAAEAFGSEALCEQIEAQDNRLAPALQYRLLKSVAGLVKHAQGALVAGGAETVSMDAWLARYRDQARALLSELPDYLAGGYADEHRDSVAQYREDGVPEPLAGKIANVQSAGGALDILGLAQEAQAARGTVAALYYRVGDWLGLAWLQKAILDLTAEGHWSALARASLRDDCYRAHRHITGQLLRLDETEPRQRIDAWYARHQKAVDFVRDRLAALQGGDALDFAALSVAVRDLTRLGAGADRL